MVQFLAAKEIILINQAVICKYTPGEITGVKDASLLESVINRPMETVFGEDAYPTIFHKAAALFVSLTQNHSFHNANKRTGYTAMVVFLYKKGYVQRIARKSRRLYCKCCSRKTGN